MALQIRRGSDDARQGLVFANGELVWVSDRRKLYVGDGTTAGGYHILETSVDGSHGLVFDTVTQTLQVDRPIPSVAGQGGKFLTTNGTTLSWATVTQGGGGTLSGNLVGDLVLSGHNITGTGNVNINGNVFANNVYSSNVFADDSGTGLQIYAKEGNSLCVNYYNGTQASPTLISPGDVVGALSVKGYNGSSYEFAGALVAFWDATANTTSAYPASTVGIVAGNNTTDPVMATLNYAGTFSAPTLKTGSYTTTQRNTLAAEYGMIIYNTSTNKFQGYQNTGGVTPEWVDLS